MSRGKRRKEFLKFGDLYVELTKVGEDDEDVNVEQPQKAERSRVRSSFNFVHVQSDNQGEATKFVSQYSDVNVEQHQKTEKSRVKGSYSFVCVKSDNQGEATKFVSQYEASRDLSHEGRSSIDRILCVKCGNHDPLVPFGMHVCRPKKSGTDSGSGRQQADTNSSSSGNQLTVTVQKRKKRSQEKVPCPKCFHLFLPQSVIKHVAKCTANQSCYGTCRYCGKRFKLRNMARHVRIHKKKHEYVSQMDNNTDKTNVYSEELPLSSTYANGKEEENFILLTDPSSLQAELPGKESKSSGANSAKERSTAYKHLSIVNKRSDVYPRNVSEELAAFKESCNLCGKLVNPTGLRDHKRRCKGLSRDEVFCKFCLEEVRGQDLQQHLASCTENPFQIKLAMEAKVIDVPYVADASAAADADREGASVGDGSLTCAECGTQFGDKKDLHEHLIVSHHYQWRTKFPNREAFQRWFLRKQFDQSMRRIDRGTVDGCAQEAFCCFSLIRNSARCRCRCRLTVRYIGPEVIARYMDIHNHTVVQPSRRLLSRGCRQMLVKMLQDGMTISEVMAAARKELHPQSIDYSLITRDSLCSLRRRHVIHQWEFGEIDLDQLSSAAAEAAEAERAGAAHSAAAVESGPQSPPLASVADAEEESGPPAAHRAWPSAKSRMRQAEQQGARSSEPAEQTANDDEWPMAEEEPAQAEAVMEEEPLAALSDAAIPSEPSEVSLRRDTKDNINNIIWPCLQRAMLNPHVSEKQLQVIRSQLTGMIADLQPR